MASLAAGASGSSSDSNGGVSVSTNETVAIPSPPPPTKVLYSREDKCTWDQRQVPCGQPRSCYDCLNVPLVGLEVRLYDC